MANITNAVIPAEFTFNNAAIRAVNKDGEIWFVASDVAAVLDYRNAPDMTRLLDDDEKGTHFVRTLGGKQEVTVINESGIYHAVLKSRKPEAKAFRKWVTKEVLPAIRRTGSYSLTITKEQQGELATRIAERFPEGTKRPYAWSRFNNHFRLASYKDLPASRFEEACQYISQMVYNPPETLPVPTGDIMNKRFLAYFDRDRKMTMQEIPEDAIVLTEKELAPVIRDPGSLLRTETIINILAACSDVLTRRAKAIR